MAKRKKTAKKTTRRRRVGAIGGDGLKLILGAIGGSIVAGLVGSKLPESIDPKIKGVILAAGGYFVAKQSSPIVKGMGIGIAAAGGLALAKAVLPAGTIGSLNDAYMNGFHEYVNNPQMNAIAGFSVNPNNPQMNVISGIETAKMAGAGIS